MTSRLLPYATSPGRLLAQLFSDLVVAAWTSLWVLVALAVHGAVTTIAGVGQQFERAPTAWPTAWPRPGRARATSRWWAMR